MTSITPLTERVCSYLRSEPNKYVRYSYGLCRNSYSYREKVNGLRGWMVPQADQSELSLWRQPDVDLLYTVKGPILSDSTCSGVSPWTQAVAIHAEELV